MGLLSFFRREPASQASAGTSAPRKRGSKAVQADPAEQVQLLRQRARHRLIGAAVLVGVGIVAFPLVFETQPRPVPMDLPIVIPSHERTPAFTPSVAVPASLPEAARAQVAPAVAAEPARDATDAPPELPVDETPTAPKAQPAAEVDKPTATSARYVVQVGAFADKKAAQEARDRLERKGLKTYAQVAQTKEGPRIRVRLGPFASKAEADKAASMAQALGLAGKVLTL